MSWMNTYEAKVLDSKGGTMDSIIVESVDMQRALERLARTLASRDTSKDQRAVRLTIDLMQSKRV